ncbi:DUF202 domain-containing protein [Nocardia sp. CA-107356]|uniref:DUF202 domain-containing protein n=1 Tax=Nocardia sp. CA-107356 TaxID=3239972 RepID=UPI003D8AE916
MTDAIPREPGLQPERTILAWRRTMSTTVVVALAFVKTLPGGGHPWLMGGLVALGGVAVVTVAGLSLRHTRYRNNPAHAGTVPTLLAGLLCLGVVVGAICCGVDLLTVRVG